MSQLTVIDASVAIKWFVVEKSGHNEAIEVLDSLQSAPEKFAVPELFFNEMLSVLCKLLNDKVRVQSYLKLLENLGLTRIGNGSELLSLASTFAVEHRLSGYDAIYAATAKLVNGHWLTADARAHKKVEHLSLSRLL